MRLDSILSKIKNLDELKGVPGQITKGLGGQSFLIFHCKKMETNLVEQIRGSKLKKPYNGLGGY